MEKNHALELLRKEIEMNHKKDLEVEHLKRYNQNAELELRHLREKISALLQ